MYFSHLPAIIFISDIYTTCSDVVDYCLIIFVFNGTLHRLCTFCTFALICKRISHLYFNQHTSLPLHLTDVYKSQKHPFPCFFPFLTLYSYIWPRLTLTPLSLHPHYITPHASYSETDNQYPWLGVPSLIDFVFQEDSIKSHWGDSVTACSIPWH